MALRLCSPEIFGSHANDALSDLHGHGVDLTVALVLSMILILISFSVLFFVRTLLHSSPFGAYA